MSLKIKVGGVQEMVSEAVLRLPHTWENIYICLYVSHTNMHTHPHEHAHTHMHRQAHIQNEISEFERSQ